MSIVLKTKWIVVAVIVAILALFITGYICGHKKGDRVLNDLKSAYSDSLATYKTEINGKTTYIAQIEQEIATKSELIRLGEIERKELRAINLKQVNELTKLKFRIDTLLEDVAHNGQIIDVNKDSTLNNLPKEQLTSNDSITKQKAILLPFSFEKKDEWLELKGRFDPQGKLDVKLDIKADVNVFTGWDKTLKSYKSVVISDSPYLQTIGIKSFKLDLKKPTRYGIGLQVGYGLLLGNPVKTAPYIGVGLSYNFIRF